MQQTDFAVRSDPASSTIEIAGFMAPDGWVDRVFCALALPTREPTGCVLITSPLYAENARNYRREVILSRDLAGRGIASLRFHYRGTGYSDGDPAALTFSSMRADAVAALAQLRERCPGIPVGLVGTRLGALVAGAMASAEPSAPIVLWDPVPSGASFFQEAAKAHRAGGMVADKQHGSAAAGFDDLWATGSLDSLGYRLPVGLRDSLEGVSLADALGKEARPILIVSVVPSYEPNPLAASVAEELRGATGAEVELRRIEGRLSWWTSRDSWDPDEEHPPTREVIDRSAAWLQRRLVGVPAT